MNPDDIMVFADLDDTLFSTRRKLSTEQFASSVAVTQANNGSHSYMTTRHRRLLDWINPQRLIPVTARGSDAFANVEPWICKGPFTIIANGASVLDQSGQPVEAWTAVMNNTLQAHRNRLHELPALIADAAQSLHLDIRVWNVEEPVCGQTYTVVKSNQSDNGDCLVLLESWMIDMFGKDSSWQIHRNGNNLAVLPPGLSKAAATRFVMDKLSAQRDYLFVGVGDSVSDLDFMRLCDFWITPSASQLSDLTARLVNRRPDL